MTEPSTPLLRQYHAIKKQYPHALLLFRLGDFYELFYEDAVVAARELQITLTARHRERGQPVPMCGVPYHAAENYIARLLRAGHKVAVCEQLEEPSKSKKLVRRDVVRVITPGTATETLVLEARENNFLAAVAGTASPSARADATFGLAYVDVSTGEFRATEFSGPQALVKLRDELGVLAPRELLLAQPTHLFAHARLELDGLHTTITRLEEWVFAPDYASRLLREQFGVAVLSGFGLEGHPQATAAAGALLHYLRETSAVSAEHTPATSALAHLDRIRFYEQAEALVLDQTTVRNLELVAPIFPEERDATLLAALDETRTSMGGRLLRAWILRPLVDREEIEARLDAVAALHGNAVLREELRRTLDGVLDLERLTGRITLGVASPRELAALGHSLARLPVLHEQLRTADSARLQALRAALDPQVGGLAEIGDRIRRAIADNPPALSSEPGIIREGYDAELDALRQLSRQSHATIAAMEQRERQRTGIASLKVRFNQVFGYYLEVSKPNLHLVPPEYERKQTLANAERFTTPELKEYERKVLTAEERILEIERRLFGELRAWVAQQAPRLRQAAAAVAELDVLACFAHLAAARGYVRPQWTEAEELLIVGGRHPVMERLVEQRGERFVPNDLYLNSQTHRILLVTGPNMGGKSTYLRQAALIVILAQMGSFVPAREARLPIVDRIFTRIGASDNLARGRSTFLVEMSEVAAILNLATPHSLVLLDEVGRGTATFDGLSLAWAVVEFLATQARPWTLFATHYHELTELEQLLPGVRNVHVSVREAGSDIVFLRQVEPGPADKSYGIEVARLAGLPRSVIERAREILRQHEQSEHRLSETLAPAAVPATPAQPALFTPLDREVLDALRTVDLENLTPLEALNLLARLKKQIER
ncbi:MAG: DNA mismatch repair protein MutS [Acidobacteriia bacterium]|jgi:DNA mismatch repair protein MutS|nr:DNA mismatch repair protein MutS [Terriglobia bacterium]